MGQASAGAKEQGGEIVAAGPLLEGLVLEGKAVTGDALFAQRDLCRQITEGGGHYLLALKDNQPSIKREVQDVFRSPCVPLFVASRPIPTPTGSSVASSG